MSQTPQVTSEQLEAVMDARSRLIARGERVTVASLRAEAGMAQNLVHAAKKIIDAREEDDLSRPPAPAAKLSQPENALREEMWRVCWAEARSTLDADWQRVVDQAEREKTEAEAEGQTARRERDEARTELRHAQELRAAADLRAQELRDEVNALRHQLDTARSERDRLAGKLETLAEIKAPGQQAPAKRAPRKTATKAASKPTAK